MHAFATDRGLSSVLLLALLSAILLGCAHNEYELELIPEGGKIERQLSAHRTGGSAPDAPDSPESSSYASFPADELKVIAEAYGREAPEQLAAKHSFRGQFETEAALPDDIGGRGTYLRWESLFGWSAAYVERFRGEPDWVGQVETRREHVDRLVAMILVWLESELGETAHWPRYQAFLDTEFRHDIHNLALYAWGYTLVAHRSPQQSEEIFAELAVRSGQYLLEQGYFETSELPQYARAINNAAQKRPSEALDLVRDMLIVRLARLAKLSEQELAESRAEEWRFLQDVPALQASFDAALESTPEYKQFLRQRTEAKGRGVSPSNFLGQLALRAFAPQFELVSDHLVLKLKIRQEPYFTNGRYQASERRVVWDRSLPPREKVSPGFATLAYAFWAQPDDRFQRRHFGQPVLSGRELLQYAVWEAGLSEAERQVWTDFITGLQPEDEVEAKLKAFRFPNEPPDKPSLAEPIITAIRSELAPRE